MSQLRKADIGTASPSGERAVHTSPVGQAYERHRPEETLLYKTLQAHWRTFLSDLESAGDSSPLPAFVVSEVEDLLLTDGALRSPLLRLLASPPATAR